MKQKKMSYIVEKRKNITKKQKNRSRLPLIRPRKRILRDVVTSQFERSIAHPLQDTAANERIHLSSTIPLTTFPVSRKRTLPLDDRSPDIVREFTTALHEIVA